MSRRRKTTRGGKRSNDEDNGFEDWGGYMAAKRSKLVQQFEETSRDVNQRSNIFKNVAILVNGYTDPSADRLKQIMAQHGGSYHLYQSGSIGSGATTHIIASNLANVKMKNLTGIPVVKPAWIVDSIASEKLLDCCKYLLCTNANSKQPSLNFAPVLKQAEKTGTLTAADPNFLAEFFSNSRLHLISTLATEMKSFVARLRKNSDGKFPARKALKILTKGVAEFVNLPIVMHIDMDCFFVSVGLRNRFELRGCPVVVTHAQNTYNRNSYSEHSMSEVASCSYEARECGVKNGMLLGAALKLCPNLKTINYDFAGYRQVSKILYETMALYTLDIEAVSCDEMYVDVGPILSEASIDVASWATHIRGEITLATGCPCSAGFGANRLQARLATKKAKPAGQFHLKLDQVEEYMSQMSAGDLPGVGYATVAKLNEMGLLTCGDVQKSSATFLQSKLGQKVGSIIFHQARGVDRKPLNFEYERKSVSVDINYGIRFKNKEQAYNFLEGLSVEVWNRLRETEMRSKCITLKLLVRAADAPVETPKYLGCGVCDVVNRSSVANSYFVEAASIYKEAKNMLDCLNVPPHELRGVGVHITKLEKSNTPNGSLNRYLVSKSDANVPLEKKQVVMVTNKRDKSTNVERLLKTEIYNRNKNDLTSYFNLREPRLSEDVCLTKDVDILVLKELPEDVRLQVIKEYGLSVQKNRFTSQSDKNRSVKSSFIDEIRFDSLTWEQLKWAVRNWLRSAQKPSRFDVNIFGDHMKRLAVEGKIERLQVVVNLVYRNVKNLKLGSWQNAYDDIVEKVQEGMVVRYGHVMFLPKKFL